MNKLYKIVRKSMKIKTIAAIALIICIISACGCANPDTKANSNETTGTEQAAATVNEPSTETQTNKTGSENEFYKMKKSDDGASYEYSDSKYNVSIKTDFQAQGGQQYKAEIDINGKKADISEQYEQCPSMTQIELAFTDLNGDGKEDIAMRMMGYNCWAFAAFVNTNDSYVKVEEPEDSYGITVNILSGGKMEVTCADINYKEEMNITPELSQVLAPGADGIYDDKENLVKELKIDAKGRTDTYSYEFEKIDGKTVLAVDKIILYNSTSTGAAYTRYYALEDNQFKLIDTKIYYSSKRTR